MASIILYKVAKVFLEYYLIHMQVVLENFYVWHCFVTVCIIFLFFVYFGSLNQNTTSKIQNRRNIEGSQFVDNELKSEIECENPRLSFVSSSPEDISDHIQHRVCSTQRDLDPNFQYGFTVLGNFGQLRKISSIFLKYPTFEGSFYVFVGNFFFDKLELSKWTQN